MGGRGILAASESALLMKTTTSFLVGIFVGMVVGFRSRLNLRKTVKSLQMQNRELKEKAMEEKEEKTEEE